MRIGIIDLGTNSVRFDVYERTLGADSVVLLHRDKLMVRLGDGVFNTGRLSVDAIGRAIDAISAFKQIARELHVSDIIAVGTSALREAIDSQSFVAQLHRETGVALRIISGKEEARLIALGILHNQAGLERRFALADIGGGSTEIAICNQSSIETLHSLDVGVARIQQLFLHTSPPNTSERPEATRELREHIVSLLANAFSQGPPTGIRTLVGSSGTARALGAILCEAERETRIFATDQLRALNRQMTPLGPTELLAIPGMESKRVDLILGGSILLEEIANYLGVESVSVTDYSLRDGLLLQVLERIS